MDQKRKLQILGILLFAFSLMLFISLSGHRAKDDLLIQSDEAVYGNPFEVAYSNPGGMMGAYLSYILLFFLGWTAYFMALFLMVLGAKIVGLDLGRRLLKHAGILWGMSFLILMVFDIGRVARGMVSIIVPDGVGVLGQTLIEIMIRLVGVPGAYIIGIAAMVCTLVYYGAISHRFRNAVSLAGKTLGAGIRDGWERFRPGLKEFKDFIFSRNRAVIKGNDFDRELTRAVKKRTRREKPAVSETETPEASPVDKIIYDRQETAGSKTATPGRKKVVLTGGTEPAATGEGEDGGEVQEFAMPDLELLKLPEDRAPAYSEKELAETARSLRETLETFGVRISGNIEMFPGPVITRFEIRPAAGIKVNQIANLSEDLALNLRAKSIRIVAPIPGKAAVGIEIPNRNPQMVYLREILASDKFQHNTFQLPICLGKDISGKPFVADLTAMPHLLVAGTTGSGKSVCINAMITSLMYCRHPNQLKFIFIDPKMLELTIYKGIPYLEDKVVTNSKQAERVLSDVVTEMESRYRVLAGASVRNIVDYNSKQKNSEKRLPYIVIIIDELADLMMSTQSSRVELLITRLAQMARAVGIHLVLATQRPSVDVITGLIKANFPARIAFQVATKTDSRTILDGNGAERLLGKGDLLFLESGLPEPRRLHGAFISSEETERLVAFIKEQPYSQVKVEEAQAVAEEKSQMRQYNDPVLLEAIETVVRQGQASVSLLQRKLGVGYQRAARIIDDLEEMKIIGSYNESKARDVLVDKSFLDNLKNGKIAKP